MPTVSEAMRRVGEYREEFNMITGQSLPVGAIFQSDGLLKHIQKRHPDCVADMVYIQDVISSPDYIGSNPKEPDSVELVKVVADNLMVCIKLDRGAGYLYVASFFKISNGKLANRLQSGRLIKIV